MSAEHAHVIQSAVIQSTDPTYPYLGKLHWGVIPYADPVIAPVMYTVIAVAIVVLALITVKGWWGYIWREWLTSVDHKRIGIMYIIVSLVMLVRGFADAIMMRTHQAMTLYGDGYLPPEHYDQIFTAHAVIMIFFVATPMITGIMNIVTPLQIGGRDFAFPLVNSISLWLFMGGVVLVMLSLFFGEFAHTGWLSYVPLAGIEYSPGVGVDYWIWSLQLSGVATTLSAVNLIATILKERAPGMSLMKMTPFVWTVLGANILALIIFPIFTVAITMLALDRIFDFHFFTNELGGNQMMYVNLVWAWGHPEVYFLILPAFGIISEVVATFSRKRLFGYKSLVFATMIIMILSFLVWVHHFFTMGAGASVNAFFGIMTMIIAIPTGAKLFNWIFTMYKGKVELSASMWWVIAMLFTFTIGGMTGVMLSIPSNDFVLHNSMFLVAHFHNTIIGGAVYAYLAGITYWFPKATGFKLNETLGKLSAALWFFGYFFAWVPMYLTGFDGMTRRLNYIDNPDWAPYLNVAILGVVLLTLGVLVIVINIVWSIIKHNDPAYKDVTGDPWNGRTLEWGIQSPPPAYNFAVLPKIEDREALGYLKRKGEAYSAPAQYQPIHMPKATWAGPIIGLFVTICSFAIVWHVWWLAVVGFVLTIGAWIAHSFVKDRDYYVPVDEIKKDHETLLKNNANRTF